MDYDRLFEIVKKSSVDIKYKPADKALPVGVSKFGGKPHLPKDFVCPICKHGAQDFEPIP